jgi:hypothetical protein
MSKTSMRERNKAIRKAWEREQQLVHEGHGTRDWTEEQQQDILNPDKGKAYDKQGRAFEGQHMKCAAEYPEYQGNPDNIQFLTKDEHLEAHKGSWQKPTNWYYDPVAKDFTVFGKDELIPCSVIALSKPVVTVVPKLDPVIENTENSPVSEIKRERASLSPEKIVEMSSAPKNIKTTAPPKSGGKLIGGLKAVGRFIVNHPIESLEIACVVIGGVAKLVSSFSGSRNSSGSHTSSTSTSSGSSSKTDIVTKVADIVEKANRALPGENDVSRHKQRYHTKDGIVWRDKAPYHRGGKNS